MLGTIIVSLILAAIVAAIISSLVRGHRNGGSCACCGSCGRGGQCACGRAGHNSHAVAESHTGAAQPCRGA